MTRPAKTAMSLRERQRAATRVALLDAALQVFSEVGFGLAAVEDIAAAAGASKGTLYTYFPDGKNGLFRELYSDLGRRTIERAEELRANEKDPRERIMAVARALLEVCTDPVVGRFYMIDGPALGQVVKPVLGTTSGRFQELVAADLREARRGRKSQKQGDVDVLAALLVGAMRPAGQKMAEDPGALDSLLDGIGVLVDGVVG